MLCAGSGFQAYAYVTELPPGYERLSYAELQPDPDVAGEVFPPHAKDYDNKRVFIKGYIYPGKQQSGIRQFVLCRDNGDCCFGGQPKLTDRILVNLQGPLRLEYSTTMHRLAGTFHLEPSPCCRWARGRDLSPRRGLLEVMSAHFFTRLTPLAVIVALFTAAGCESQGASVWRFFAVGRQL